MTTARGESVRNAPRTSSRNSGSLNKLIFELGARKFPWMLYLYCAGCREFEVLVLASTDPTKVTPPAHVARLASSLGTPIIVIRHDAKDEDMTHAVDLHTYLSDGTLDTRLMSTSWREVANALLALQMAHQIESGGKRCANHDATLLSKGTWRLRDGDASVSNLARMIPGVRHIDIDAAIYCPKCYGTQAVIEASSDGMEDTNLSSKTKEVYMSLRIASAIGADTYLLQHHVKDVEHKHPTMLTGWAAGADDTPFLAPSIMTWGAVRREMRASQSRHVCS